jgi:hypothetical protein
MGYLLALGNDITALTGPRPLAWAALASAALSGPACRDLVGASDFSLIAPTPPFAEFPAACTACIARECATLLGACAAGSGCGDLLACEGPAPGAGRRLRCELEHEAGVEPAGAIGSCLVRRCPAECSAGTSYDCAEMTEKLPVPKGEGFEWRLEYRDLAGVTPMEGVRVRACLLANWLDPECRTPDAEGTTDAEGHVVLHLSFAFLSVKQPWIGLLQASGGAAHSELRFRSSPAIRDTDQGVRVLSAAEHVSRAALLGLSASMDLGELAIEARDCWGAPAQDVMLEAEDARGELPVRLAQPSTSQAEFLEVPPGAVRVRVRSLRNGSIVNETAAHVLARTRTVLELEPGIEH